jgi:hypothetical protein
LESFGQAGVNTRRRGKDPDQHRLVLPVTPGLAQSAGIALVQNFQDAIVVDGGTAGRHFGTAGRAGMDFFGDNLTALDADLH